MLVTGMTEAYAADIVTWRYPAPYDCYDMTGADPAFLTNPASGYFALMDAGTLIGFRNIGHFQASADGRSYEMLIRPEPAADAVHG
jgi:hypothetical protein